MSRWAIVKLLSLSFATLNSSLVRGSLVNASKIQINIVGEVINLPRIFHQNKREDNILPYIYNLYFSRVIRE